MEVFVKVSALAVLGVVIIVTLRRTLPEMSLVVSVSLICTLVMCAAGVLAEMGAFIEKLAGWANIETELAEPLVRTLGISIIARLASDMCRESGVIAAASVVEILGGAVAVSLAAPLIFGLLGQITS